MNREQINEIKTQLWDHLRSLRGRIEELSEEGYSIPLPEVWMDPTMVEEVWQDRAGVHRSNWWLVDQLLFCQSEAKYWKELSG